MSPSSNANPLLAFQPAFTYSMPTQLLIHGSVLTLLSILTLHLLFTAKYHYPLAPTNFFLLLSAVTLTMISTIVVVVMINHALYNRSRYWPFMFDYVEVTMPPPDWAPLALVGWYIMQSLVTFLAHATHIQFLTLLFPSSLERKLIIAFLGPLCVFASAMYFTHFLSDPNLQDLGDAIRNTATSTLSLLYTSGLLIWAYAVNRKRAWDTEGGTCGFGLISLTLAFSGTAANFIEVKEDRLRWLPWLVNTVLLWQSWAGFWWWVGAGMWSGEVADIERREERARRRESKRLKKRARMLNMLVHKTNRAANEFGSSSPPIEEAVPPTEVTTSGLQCSRASVLSVRLRRRQRRGTIMGSRRRHVEDEGDMELRPLGATLADQRPSTAATDISSSLPSNDSSNQISFFGPFFRPAFLDRWLHRLSAAHNAAAKQQARSAQTEGIKRWGLGAMSERVISEQLGCLSRAQDDEDEDEEWVSEGVEDEDHSSRPDASTLDSYGDPPTQHQLRQQRSRRKRTAKEIDRSNALGSGNMGMDHGHSWAWKGPLMKARLRDVTSF
ncbi:hypothetical protein CROQUDRAFT_650414 [Cronartium quercuum f. sp. fusiforme G11]|uniref:Uncharacterized protein n=1 Tax=Cronartium quercuum f. sp. fusiforme G11 TaxID=708437 RepID=A0A9P6NTA9_9BASI|nr:hypothetical protein CROQUDRAFT_650414 [Cronartium quercuum f. sp. fusiforme G11]